MDKQAEQAILKMLQQGEHGLTQEEREKLEEWKKSDEGRPILLKQLQDQAWYFEILRTEGEEAAWRRLESAIDMADLGNQAATLRARAPFIKLFSFWYKLAAMVLIVIGVSLLTKPWKFIGNTGDVKQPNVADISPGSEKAILTLEDGRKISLDSTATGQIVSQGKTQIRISSKGQLTYNKASEPVDGVTKFNSLVTPKSGQFSIVLPDGSRVWLNNASGLHYPTVFGSGPREVELFGEAYFEIAKDSKRPFRVKIVTEANVVKNSYIDVLGTAFNVTAYSDEERVTSTLVNGSIRFSAMANSVVLKPAEQTVLNQDGQLQIAKNVDVDEVISWKSGFFLFDHSSLENTMRQLARWYDVEVVYKGDKQEHLFMGRIRRDLPLSEVLRGLENDKIHFELDGHKLTVLP